MRPRHAGAAALAVGFARRRLVRLHLSGVQHVGRLENRQGRRCQCAQFTISRGRILTMAVIDSDAHVLETEHTWDYMLESERALKPRIVPTPNDPTSGGESWLVDGTYIGKARNVGHDTSRAAREMEDITARLKHMDELNIDVQVLYPTIFLRPFTRQPEVELAVARSYNRWLVDIWKKAPERLRWVAVLPLLSMDKAIEEARYAKENGACGIFMRGLEGDKHISDPYFFSIYEEASRP